MVHYSLGFTAYKAASEGGFPSIWDSESWLQLHLLAQSVLVVHYSLGWSRGTQLPWLHSLSVTNRGVVFLSMWDSEPWLQLHLLAQSVLMVHYSLGFTAYKAASGGVFLRCGTLSLGYNCTSWPCTKMVSTDAYSILKL